MSNRIDKKAITVEEVADLLQATDQYSQWYLNLITGETEYTNDFAMMFDEREEITNRLESEDGWAALPNSFEIHEWDIMRRFSLAQDDSVRDELLDAIHGRGAFRMFRSTVERRGLLQAWYDYRDAALEGIAREWLESNGIELDSDGDNDIADTEK